MESVKLLESDLEDMRVYFRSGKTKDASWRRSQLKGLLMFLKEEEKQIFKALQEDLGKHPVEAFRDEACFYIYISTCLLVFSRVNTYDCFCSHNYFVLFKGKY